MPVRYGRFEMPKTLSKEESSATETYAKFTAEPFEASGPTVGIPRSVAIVARGWAIPGKTPARSTSRTCRAVEEVTDIV